MSTAERAITILACLAPLTGTRSSGIATVRSTGATGNLPAGCYAFPVINDQVDYARPFRHASVGPDGNPRSVVVSQSGTDVTITSVLGGKGVNLAAGTRLLWFPSNPGIEQLSQVSAAPMTGGDADPSPISLSSLVWSEEPIDGANTGSLIKTALQRCPAGILQWAGRSATTRPHGPKSLTRTDQWQLLICASSLESHHQRALQGMTIVDLAEAELADRASVDGIVLSSPPIKMLGVRPGPMSASVYVSTMRFETSITIESTDDTKRRTYEEWQRTRFDFPTMVDEGEPTFDVVGGATYPQP